MLLVVCVLLGHFSAFILGSGNTVVKEFVFVLVKQSKDVLDVLFGVGLTVGGFGLTMGCWWTLFAMFVWDGPGQSSSVLGERTE